MSLVFQCPDCNFGTNTRDDFKEHYSTQRQARNWRTWKERVYNCIICEKEIRDEEVLGAHYK
jgi:DNA-directed RNA polymerase subunit RPC12/RpoP